MSASHSRDFFGRAAADNNNNLSHMPDSFASQQIMVLDFRNGSNADIAERETNVRFTPESGHWLSGLRCPLSAGGGHRCHRCVLTLPS
jgi:hypothetical protein